MTSNSESKGKKPATETQHGFRHRVKGFTRFCATNLASGGLAGAARAVVTVALIHVLSSH